MSALFDQKLASTDWQLIKDWKDELVRLLDERRIDDHPAWRLIAWVEDMLAIAEHGGLFKPDRTGDHDAFACLRVTERISAAFTYAETTGHHDIASALALLQAAIESNTLQVYNVITRRFMCLLLDIPMPRRDDPFGLLGPGDPVTAMQQFLQAAFGAPTGLMQMTPDMLRATPQRQPYLVTGPAYLSDSLAEQAAARARQVIECARQYDAMLATRFDLNALINDDVYSADTADDDVEFVRPVFGRDPAEWVGEFLAFWNSHAAESPDTHARLLAGDPDQLVLFAAAPRRGQAPGPGWTLLHTARLLGLWTTFGIR